ncbi:MAG: GAF domain-containing protein, partial [Anaerolineales bacterium]
MTDMMDQMSLQQEPGGYDRHEPISESPLAGESSERRMRMRPQRKQRAKMLSAFEANRRVRAYKRLVQAAMESENNIDRLMQAIAKMAGEMLGDLCSITVLNTHNEMYHIAAIYDKDPAAVALIQQLLKDVVDIPRDQGATAKVMRSGKPLLQPAPSVEEIKAAAIPSLTEYIDRIGVASSLIVPIQGRSGMLGTLSASRHRGGKPYTAADQAFLTEIAFLLGVALEYFTVIDSLRREVAARQFAKEA